MSGIQDRAMPALRPLLIGERLAIPSEEHGLLASWAVMTAMVIDSLYDESGVSSGEREDFKANKATPEDWSVWVGRYEGFQWNAMTVRRAIALGNDAGDRKPMGQTNVFAIGQAAFLVASGIGRDAVNPLTVWQGGWRLLHPLKPSAIQWRALPAQTDFALEAIAEIAAPLYKAYMLKLHETWSAKGG
jgi:hypothetical protein